jgi:hypothetical protein
MAAGRLSFALAEVIDQHGLLCELDTDRGSHYFHTPKEGEAVSKTWFSWRFSGWTRVPGPGLPERRVRSTRRSD